MDYGWSYTDNSPPVDDEVNGSDLFKAPFEPSKESHASFLSPRSNLYTILGSGSYSRGVDPLDISYTPGSFNIGPQFFRGDTEVSNTSFGPYGAYRSPISSSSDLFLWSPASTSSSGLSPSSLNIPPDLGEESFEVDPHYSHSQLEEASTVSLWAGINGVNLQDIEGGGSDYVERWASGPSYHESLDPPAEVLYLFNGQNSGSLDSQAEPERAPATMSAPPTFSSELPALSPHPAPSRTLKRGASRSMQELSSTRPTKRKDVQPSLPPLEHQPSQTRPSRRKAQKFVCEFANCNRTSTRQGDMKRHMQANLHAGDRRVERLDDSQHWCEWCPSTSFPRKDALTRHQTCKACLANKTRKSGSPVSVPTGSSAKPKGKAKQ